MKIKTFASSINTFSDDLDERVNKWIDEHYEKITIKDLKYSIGDKYKSVCIVYSVTWEDIVNGRE